ncbi:MAG: PorT family protein [Paludibacteraceae bacterium]|nr:PorT family protein [Paludibacteraceae bacterium]
MQNKLGFIFKVVFIWLLCISSASAQARRNFLQEVSVGAFGGVNMSQVRFLHNSTAYSTMIGDQSLFNKRGGTFGVSARYIAQEHFGVILDLSYTSKGYCEIFRPRNGEDVRLVGLKDKRVDFNGVDLDRTISYLDIPILAHIYFGSKSRFFLNIGPQMSFKLSEKDNSIINEVQKEILTFSDPRINRSIATDKMDFSLHAALGYDLHLDKVSAMLELRWAYGVHDLYPHSKADWFQRSNTQNLGLVLRAYVPVKKFHGN